MIHGPTSPEAAGHVETICDEKEMPLLETRMDPYTEQPVINLHPHTDTLAGMFLDLVEAWDWDSFTIIYESAPWSVKWILIHSSCTQKSHSRLPVMHELIKKYDKEGFTVTVRELDVTNNQNYRPQLIRVKHSDDKNIIVSSSIDALPEILKQMQQVGLFTEEHQFIFTCLDMHTLDLEPYQHSGANITGMRLISPEHPMVVHVTEFFAEKFDELTAKEEGRERPRNNRNKKSKNDDDDEEDDEDDDEDDDKEEEEDEDDTPDGLTADQIRVDTALTYDAVLVFSEVVNHEGGVRVKNIKCEDDSGWRSHGISDSMAMKTMPPIRGLSGEIQFDQKGYRSNFQIELIELVSDGIKKIGTWNTSDGLYLERSHPVIDESVLSLRNKTFFVLTALVRLFLRRNGRFG